jgi:TonB family protein
MMGAFAATTKPTLPMPESVLIARRTFLDFGPPFEFFEIFLVRRADRGILVQRLQLTPDGGRLQPAQIALASSQLTGTVANLLGSSNPCNIPEKELRREKARCKHCLTFSGADVTMHVSCAGKPRRIRMDILDRDLFDVHPQTPQHTSWTMVLLGRLDQALGSTIMDRPAFGDMDPAPPTPRPESDTLLQDLAAGKFDAIFERGQITPSQIYRKALEPPPPPPTVRLISSVPVQPVSFTLPAYPLLANMAGISGTVSFTVVVEPDGQAANLKIVAGHPLLMRAVENAAKNWRFPTEAAGHEIQMAMQFKLAP